MPKSATLILSLLAALSAPSLARAADNPAPPPPAPANENSTTPNGNMKPASRTPGQVVDDTAITAKVKSQLIGDPATKARHIDVTTRGGVVSLTGQVDSSDERVRAVQIARNTKGVHSGNPVYHATGLSTLASHVIALGSKWVNHP